MPDGVVTHLEARLTSTNFGTSYYYLFAEKYDGYYDDPIGAWEDMLEQYQAEQETARIFSEGQGDYFPDKKASSLALMSASG